MPHEISVVDSRHVMPPPSLQTHGFQIVVAPSTVTTWERTTPVEGAELSPIEAIARREAEEVVTHLTGSRRVYSFDHTWRSSRRSNFDSSQGPGGRAANFSSAVARTHTDNTPATARLKITELVERGVVPPEAEDTSRFRAAIINVWRAYGRGGVVKQYPLGFIKYDTVKEAHCFPYTLAYDGRCGINGSIEHDPGHEWHYYEAMRPEEVLCFINYLEPEAPGGRVKQVYHAAIELLGDEHPSAEAAERLSLEVRMVVLFPRA